MANSAHGLHLVAYEEATDTGEYVAQGDGRVLDDEEVERVLLGASDKAYRDGVRGPVVASAAASESDALAAMRGIVVGLAWAAPVWCLVAAIILLT